MSVVVIVHSGFSVVENSSKEKPGKLLGSTDVSKESDSLLVNELANLFEDRILTDGALELRHLDSLCSQFLLQQVCLIRNCHVMTVLGSRKRKCSPHEPVKWLEKKPTFGFGKIWHSGWPLSV